MPDQQFWRDASGRLAFDLPRVKATGYPAVCRSVADTFDLVPAGEIVVGLEQMFWDFRRGDQVVGLDWDIWSGLMVVARSGGAEPLVRDIAAWFGVDAPRQREGTVADWYAALAAIVDHGPTAYWHMANGAVFWWTPCSRRELHADRFAEQPFLYAEIESVTIYREARAGSEVMGCDWPGLCEALAGVRSVRVTPLAGVRPWPSSPPTEALVLVADAEPGAAADGGT